MDDISPDISPDSCPSSGINIRAESYSIARSTSVCPHCRGETKVVALLVPPGHRTRSVDEGDEGADESGHGVDSWECADRHALLFYVESLPEAVRHRMQRLAPMFRFAAGPATEGPYWVNHCERCGGIQEDHDLFCEPQGAFVPLDSAQASTIELVSVQESLEAAAGGYALDPEFIGSEPEA